MGHPEAERIVYVRCPASKKRGSGYWISSRFILTVRHLFEWREDPGSLDSPLHRASEGQVAFDIKGLPQAVRVVWSGEDKADVALLKLVDGSRPPESRNPDWAGNNNAALECEARGYPKALIFKETPDRKVPDREDFRGRLLAGAGTTSGLLHAEARWITEDNLDEWQGMSGAGLFCDGYFVGVITHVTTGRLLAYPVQSLVEHRPFVAAFEGFDPRSFKRQVLWEGADKAAIERLEPWTRKRRPARLRAPSALLLAENEVVHFDDSFRTRELGLLREFSVDRGPGLLIFTGPGGAGKTRLMLEWCRRQRVLGWIAGFVDCGVSEVAKVAEGQTSRLLVVDYPERRVDEVAAICKRMLRQDNLSVRLVLLTRSLGPWYDRLKSETKADLVEDAQVWPLRELTHAERRVAFQQASAAFDERVVADEVEVEDSELDKDDFPLYAHMRALLRGSYGEQRPPEDPELLLGKVLGHEKKHWLQSIPEDMSDDAQRMMAAITLVGVLDAGPDATLRWLWPALGLGEPHDDTRRGQLVDLAKRLYADERGVVVSLRPDVLGEQLVLEAVEREIKRRDTEGERRWLTLPLSEGAPRGAIGRALAVWSRLVSRDVDAARPRLAAMLEDNIDAWVEQCEARSWQEGEQFDPRGHEIAQAIAAHGGADLAQELEGSLPERTSELLQYRVEVMRIRVEAMRASSSTGGEELSGHLSNYGVCLVQAGRLEEAVEATLEAVHTYRKLVDARPDTFLPGLAGALNNLGASLNSLGRLEEAMELAMEALDACRKLVDKRPDAYLPHLARALNNLGASLSSVGRVDEAMKATLEALDAYRELANARPDAYLSKLAGGLNNLGIRLNSVGRVDEAMEAALEAVDAYRKLADARPDAHLPDLARALNNLGICLNSVGRVEDAMEATEEAVDSYRKLADARPDAYLPGLASALNNLGARLHSVERVEDAMEAAEEAVDAYRKLANARPGAYLPDLATALAVRGMILHSREDFQEAATSFAEGLRSLLPLFGRNPQAHAHLAISLTQALIKACDSAAVSLPDDLAEHVGFIRELIDGAEDKP